MRRLLTLNTGNDGTLTYDEFLREKVAFDRSFGFDVRDEWLSPIMRPGHEQFKPHQADIVKWAVKGGRRAIFARYGLGKSVMQLEILRLIVQHGPALGGTRDAFGVETRRGLIVAPLGVRFDIIADGRDLLDTEVRFVRSTADVDLAWSGLYVTNYESVRDGKLDLSMFIAASLDEAAVLRSFGSETYQRFLPLFDAVPYRFVATATPAPNRHKELIHYAGFLGIMDTGQALTRFFKRDSSKAGNLRIHPHKRREFMLWLNTWACFIQRPSDLGYSDDGYDLPPLDVVWEEVEVELLSDQVERDGQGILVRAGAKSAVESAREKRHTLAARVAKAMRIIAAHWADPDERGQIILWCDLNDEQDALEAGLHDLGLSFSSIRGAQSDEEVEEQLRAWLAGETYALIGKPMMLGRGLNLQQCSTAVFVGVTHKYEQTVQAIHRIHRFGQTNACTVHLLYGESETDVRDNLLTKWQEDDALTDTMSDILREFGLNATAVSAELARAMGIDRETWQGQDWQIVLNDSVIEWRDHVAAESMGLIVTSIPFGGKYEYSANYADFGHVDDNAQFWWQMDYLTPSLFRALMPGRILAIHVKDFPLYGSVTGKGVYTFDTMHAEAIAHYTGHGFDYFGMITVTTDVVRENNQTYRLSYSEMAKDHSKMGVGSPEYVLLFHKPQSNRTRGYADLPVTKDKADYSVGRWQIDAAAEWRTGGDRLLSVDELAQLEVGVRAKLFTAQSERTVYDYDAHVALADRLAARNALPGTFASLVPGSWRADVWTDVLRIDTLNSEQRKREVEAHICPFPLDIPRRLITMYSNPGELVGDPFSGLGSTVLEAVRQGRRGFGSELNPVSTADSVVYLTRHDNEANAPTLFDLLDIEGSAA
ncbi:DNA methyltransferase [Microbacterium esteraromaticum]|uniref:DNA methyltransferase n=1 Tax=Microbacterium esteraromaticum TaxID=57043 RepID=UPI002368AC48|nr:DNA methyltransferase [Microbacterium esteraromaticum]WDH77888.1 DNA methyltransferase [Microbacterium esteraromaticum]